MLKCARKEEVFPSISIHKLFNSLTKQQVHKPIGNQIPRINIVIVYRCNTKYVIICNTRDVVVPVRLVCVEAWKYCDSISLCGLVCVWATAKDLIQTTS